MGSNQFINDWKEGEIDFLKKNYGKILVSEIAEKMNKTESSIRAKANNLKIKSKLWNSPETRRKINQTNTKQPKKTFCNPSKELAYIIGVLNGDGYISIRKGKDCRLRLGVKDKDFALYFKKILEEWSRLNVCFYERKDIYYKQGFYYETILCSKVATKFLSEFYFSPKKRKTLQKTKELLFLNKQYQIEFIKGFFDSEGSISTEGRIEICNTNKSLINLCKELFAKLKIETIVYIRQHRERKIRDNINLKPTKMYRLFIQSEQDIKKFCNLINSSIKRKQERINLFRTI